MLNKLDDYPIHQTPEPIAHAGDERPQRLRPHLVQRLLRRRLLLLRHRHGDLSAPRRPRLRIQRRRARHTATLLLWFAARADRTHRDAGGAVPHRGGRAAAAHARRARRQRQRRRVRLDVLGAHERDPGSAADAVERHAPRDGRDALRSVRSLVRLGRHPDGEIRVDDARVLRHEGSLVGRARRRRTGDPAARR